MTRKLLLTGGLVVASDQGSAQILIAQVICVLYLIAVVRTMPYESDKDDVLQMCASTSLLLTLMAAFTLKAQERVDKARAEGGNILSSNVAEDTDRGVVGTMLVTVNAMVLAFAAINLMILVYPFLKTCKSRMNRFREQRRKQRELKKKLRSKLEAKQRKGGKLSKDKKDTKKASTSKRRPSAKEKGGREGRGKSLSKSDKKAVKGWEPPKKRNSTKVAPDKPKRASRSPSARRTSASGPQRRNGAPRSPSARRTSASGPQRRKSSAQTNLRIRK